MNEFTNLFWDLNIRALTAFSLVIIAFSISYIVFSKKTSRSKN